MTKTVVSALALTLAGTLAAGATELRATVDPAASEIAFSLAATLHTAEGTIKVAAGELRFDPTSGAASGQIVIDARSATTASKGRDEKMHEEVLLSAAHPEIVFVVERIEGAFRPESASDLRFVGAFKVLGKSFAATLPLRVEPKGPGRVEASGTFKVPYVAWGMKDPSVLFLRVAKEVDVRVRLVARLADAAR